MELTKKATSTKEVNAALKVAFPKYPGLSIHKSEGCWFVYSDNEETALKIAMLPVQSIYTHKLNQLSIEQWVAEVKALLRPIEKRAVIWVWHDIRNLKEKIGFDNKAEVPYEDVMKIAEHILDNGLNVMITNTKGDYDRVIYVDDKRFGQR